MKNLFLGIAITFTSASCLAQETNTNLIPCTTYEAMEKLFAKDPAAKLLKQIYDIHVEVSKYSYLPEMDEM